ncbi:19452_t:CDS:2, partial [Gigaspora margarita]
CNMHNSGTHIVPIGNYVISTKHLWQLNIIYGGNNSKLAISKHAEKYNNDTFYKDALYLFFLGMLLEAWKSKTMTHFDQIAYAWSGTIFFVAI